MRGDRKYFRVEMILDSNGLHDVMSAADGRAFDLKVAAVKLDQPEVTAATKLTGRQLILQAMEIASKTTERQITIADLRQKGKALNVPLSSIYSTVHTMKKEGKLLLVSPGVYQLQPLALESKTPQAPKVPAKGTARAVVLSLFKPGAVLTRMEIIAKAKAKGLDNVNDSMIYGMAGAGHLMKMGGGKFQLAKH